jgi:hypothetical protein
MGHRLVTAIFGVLLAAIGIVIPLIAPEAGWGGIAAAVVIGGLGIDAIIAAWRDRPALIARIGPLP